MSPSQGIGKGKTNPPKAFTIYKRNNEVSLNNLREGTKYLHYWYREFSSLHYGGTDVKAYKIKLYMRFATKKEGIKNE